MKNLHTPRGSTARGSFVKELERTPEAVAVSGVYGKEPAGLQTPAGIPRTNLEPPFNQGGSFRYVAVLWRWPLSGVDSQLGKAPDALQE